MLLYEGSHFYINFDIHFRYDDARFSQDPDRRYKLLQSPPVFREGQIR